MTFRHSSVWAVNDGLGDRLTSPEGRQGFFEDLVWQLRMYVQAPQSFRSPDFAHIDRNLVPALAPFAEEPLVVEFFELLQKARGLVEARA